MFALIRNRLLSSAYNHGTGNFLLLIEELPTEKNFGPAKDSSKSFFSLEQALLLLKKFASVHAIYWVDLLEKDKEFLKKEDYKYFGNFLKSKFCRILWDTETVSEIEFNSFNRAWRSLKRKSEDIPEFYSHVPLKLIQLGELMSLKGIPIWRFQHTPRTLIHSSITPEKIWFSEEDPKKGAPPELEFVVLDWMTMEFGHPLRDVCHVLMQIDEEVFGPQLEGYLHYYYSELVKNNPNIRQYWSLAQCENDFLVLLLGTVDYAVNYLGEDLSGTNATEMVASLAMKAKKLSHVLQKITQFGVSDMARAVSGL